MSEHLNRVGLTVKKVCQLHRWNLYAADAVELVTVTDALHVDHVNYAEATCGVRGMPVQVNGAHCYVAHLNWTHRW